MLSIQDEESMISDSLLNKSIHLSQKVLLTAEQGEIKKRYSIEMFEDLIQTVAKLKQEVSQLKSAVMQ
jgi:hypothetical protein